MTFLKLPNDIDWHDTFGRVVQLIGSKIQEKVCINWLQSIAARSRAWWPLKARACAARAMALKGHCSS